MPKRTLIYILTFFPSLFYRAMFLKERMDHHFKRVHDQDFLFFKNCTELNQDRQFIDIGANFGQSALSYSAIDGRRDIVSFEPNIGLKPYLMKVKGLLGDRYKYYMKGLGKTQGNLELIVPKVNRVLLTGEGSFDVNEVESGMVRSRIGFPITFATLKCEVGIFDDIVEADGLRPYLIKMDIQGFELLALEGMQKTIAQFRPLFLIEKNNDLQFEDIKIFFNGFNYSIMYYDRGQNRLKRSNPGDSANYLSIPTESLERDFAGIVES